MRLITTWFGTFIVDDEGKVLEKTLFPKDKEALAIHLKSINDGEILAEEEELAAGRDIQVSKKDWNCLEILFRPRSLTYLRKNTVSTPRFWERS